MSRKTRRRKASRAPRRAPLPQHLVVDLGGAPASLDHDCPICALMAASGAPVHSFDPRTGALVPLPPAPPPDAVTITLAADAAVAPHLGAAERELDVPTGCRAGELVEGLRFLFPELGAAFPPGGLELQADDGRLDPHVEVTGGRLTLAATRPRHARA